MDDKVRQAVELASRILKREGAAEVYLFGSWADGTADEHSDIDLAIRGLPPERFFDAMGEVTMKLGHLIDLVDLDEECPFTEYLVQEGKLRRVG